MFSIFNNKKQSAKEKCNLIVGKIGINHPQEPEKELESNSQMMQIKSVFPQATDSDPDDPDINDTNNHAQIIESSIQDLGHLEPNLVKDLGDLNTGPAQPILSAYPKSVFGK
ncbi:uncharacterized protein LOC111028467 [Myzus persicae]|uniref:uncharacterized protein LOC111028467 n=1 Tax=Myzus persicae TaxID=13164 RepID=UPI000B930E94|nr:uncharacterized protein LOC111028467 [Myzus persicae]